MAARTLTAAQVAWHGTATSSETETVTFDTDIVAVEIISHNGASALWFTLDGSTPAANSPTSYVIPANVTGADRRQIQTSATTVVKLLAGGADILVSVQRAD